MNHPPEYPGGGVPLEMTTIADKLTGYGGNFDIVLNVDHLSHSQLFAPPRAPCDMLYFVPMLGGC